MFLLVVILVFKTVFKTKHFKKMLDNYGTAMHF